MAVKELNVKGLTPEEAQEALNKARFFKREFSIQEWQERRKDLMLKMFDLISDDTDFVLELIDHIKACRPELLKEV